MENRKGITLIALVITIIVMLVLAGVSLNALVGENGILTQAQNAAIKTTMATYEEIINLEVASAQMQLLQSKTEFLESVQSGVSSHEEFTGSEYSIKNSSRLVITTKEEYIYIVNADSGTVAYIGTKDELNADLPTELEEADISIIKSTSNWTKDPVGVTITCDKYPTHSIEYSFDLSAWVTYSGEFYVTDNTSVYVRLANDIGATEHCSTAEISNIDTVDPVITTDMAMVTDSTWTTKSFTVTFSAQDTDASNEDYASGIGQIIWYYRPSGATEFNVYGTIQVEHTMNASSNGSRLVQNFSRLFDNMSTVAGGYDVKAEIYDVSGRVTSTSVINVTLLGTGLSDKTHSVVPGYWTNGQVKITLPTEGTLTTYYAIDDEHITTPIPYSAPFDVPENCSIYYYVTDGTNILKAETITVDNIDSTASTKDPIVTSALALSGTPTTASITTTITVQDTVSGFSHIDWYYKQSSASGAYTKVPMDDSYENYKATNSDTAGVTTSLTITKEFSGLAQGEEYCFYAEIFDVAGNSVLSPSTGSSNPLKITTDQIMVSGIVLSPTTLELWVGGSTGSIDATVSPSGAKVKDVTWHSSNASVASVEDGEVTPVAPGTATITAKSTDGSNKTSNACTVTVKKHATGVNLSDNTLSLAPGGTATLTATVLPQDNPAGSGNGATDKTVSWGTSAPTVATVDGGVVTAVGAGEATITVTTTDGGHTASCTVTVASPYYSASNKGYSGSAGTSSYVGYYADIDYDGNVDGVIYADLENPVTSSTKWNGDSDSSFSYAKGTNLKTYYISTADYSGSFGTKKVIIPNSTSGNDRFYIMALTDVDSSYHDFYNAAYNNSRFGSLGVASSVNDFGEGKTKTTTMITAWNNKTYGNQNACSSHTDMWGLTAVQACNNSGNKWFVPSRAEWSAFGYNLGITTSNYSSKGLSNFYWSSSVYSSNYAYYCHFSNGYMYRSNVNSNICVRLSATF